MNGVWGNVSGGVRRGADYDGLTIVTLGLDTGTAFKLPNGTFNLSVLNIRSRNISADDLHNLQTASGILATPTTRLWEVWYQQSFPDSRDQFSRWQKRAAISGYSYLQKGKTPADRKL